MSRSVPWLTLSDIARCTGIAWSVGSAASASWATTVRQATLPEDSLADEHHQTLDGQTVYIATTVANGCCLGAEPAETAGTDDLKVAYEVFNDEARDIDSDDPPQDHQHRRLERDAGGLEVLFPKIVILLCFLHGWLKYPRTCQAFEGDVRGGFRAGLEASTSPTAAVLGNGSDHSANGQATNLDPESSWKAS